jgi:RNA polymerase sigma-70 factor (ECF subfamily)
MSNKSLLLEWRQRWNGSLFRFLKRRVRSSVDVQDLAQETYLRLLRARDLSEVRNPLAYLLQVASHVALDWCDREPRSESIAPLDEQMLIDDQLPPEIELDAAMFQKRLDETLNSFPPMVRSVLLLRLRDERSYQEIARDLGISARQVRRYVARGYERLRAAVEE